MSSRLPARLCRNRHGTNYVFRFSIPEDIRGSLGASCITLTFRVLTPAGLSEGLFDEVAMVHIVPRVCKAYAV